MKLFWCCGCLISANDEKDALEALALVGHDPASHGFKPGARLTEIPEGQMIRWAGGRRSAAQWAAGEWPSGPAGRRFVFDKAGQELRS